MAPAQIAFRETRLCGEHPDGPVFALGNDTNKRRLGDAAYTKNQSSRGMASCVRAACKRAGNTGKCRQRTSP